MGYRVQVFALSNMIKKLLPKSLQAQLILLMLGVVLLVQAGTFVTVSWSWRQFTQKVAIDLTLTTLRTMQRTLVNMPAEKRAAFVKQVSDGQWHLWSRSLPSHTRLERSDKPKKEYAKQNQAVPYKFRRALSPFVDALNQSLGSHIRVALSHDRNPNVYVSLLTYTDHNSGTLTREWLVIPIDRITPSVSTPIIVFWLTGMGLLLLLAAAFSWHITRPLTKLAKAADQLAAGNPKRVVPSGPQETVILSERFNAMLDALNESATVQRTLLAGLPHDLKGPLSRMWLRIEMLDKSSFQDGMRNDLKDMQRMVDQFIGFVRGYDSASYNFMPISTNEWLQEKVHTWASTGCNITLTDTTSESIIIKADTLALDRLIDNLIANALQHGKEPIEIFLYADQNSVIIMVTDHGPGIAPDQQAEALRPFSRLDQARTKTGSVGLGLALAEAIAKSHNGCMELQFAHGKGLIVKISLPRTVD